jgi:hypothetical protein
VGDGNRSSLSSLVRGEGCGPEDTCYLRHFGAVRERGGGGNQLVWGGGQTSGREGRIDALELRDCGASGLTAGSVGSGDLLIPLIPNTGEKEH